MVDVGVRVQAGGEDKQQHVNDKISVDDSNHG